LANKKIKLNDYYIYVENKSSINKPCTHKASLTATTTRKLFVGPSWSCSNGNWI